MGLSREISSLLVRSSSSNITASLICLLLEAAGDNLYSFNDLFYGIAEPNYFVLIRNPKHWLVDYLFSNFIDIDAVRIYDQAEEDTYVELGCDAEIYGPFSRPDADSIRCIECNDLQEFKVELRPLNYLFQEGPSARMLSWANMVIEEDAGEAEKLLAQIYMKLDYRLVPDKSSALGKTELWILDRKNEDELIALIAQAREEDLLNIDVAEIILPSGGPAFVIRSVMSGGKMSRLLPLQGDNLYSSLIDVALPNVFIPYDKKMRPQLLGTGSNYLEAMIDYKSHECTILDMDDNDLVVLSIPRDAFQPLRNLIKYVVPKTSKKYALKFHEPYRKNPNFLHKLINKIHPSRAYKVLELEVISPDKIPVPLALEQQFRKRAPDLWLLPVESGHLLTEFLKTQDPRNFLIACAGSQNQEPEFFLIKSAFATKNNLPTDYQVFAADRDIPNLYLPCDKHLEPALFPKTRAKHLEVQPYELTILRDMGDGVEIIKIPEEAIQPIQSLEDIEIITGFNYSHPRDFDVEWRRPKKPPTKPSPPLPKKPIAPKISPEDLAPPTKKKRRPRKKKKGKAIVWGDVHDWAQKSQASLPDIDTLIENLELSPQEFLERMKDHVSSMKEWKKRKGV
jgi:hypothetical protein